MADRGGASRPACLITRPEPGAAATAARVAALGWRPVLAPALRLAPLSLAPMPEARALLLPSAAALPALRGVLPPSLPVLAVGAGTAAAAQGAGFTRVVAAEGDAASLAVLAAASLDPREGPVLLATGQGYGDELAAELERRGFSVIRRETYAATEVAELPPLARDALRAGQVRAALFLSPRSARSTLAQLRASGLTAAATGIRAVALSARVAEALSTSPEGFSAPITWGGLDVAPRPDQDALLALLGHAP
ncbi:uroporphyrinogen-III synthase [Roseomonas sp. SSH11]|uniref:Uroporphyrinogen-III synthase n=1 Tax=Pararoseomonas baculiformis TaxID=2820812 RepID=A0ABS4AKZ9_9PROT|nr:uroporphyrinogen-III synthase [Pararoseomonas baculiformis]MBP0447173.1 uroporphyrinogen-III synthase [Pararoseomonas baculiformis]